MYQRWVNGSASFVVMGFRVDDARCALGVGRIHSEAFAREDFLIAGESVEAPLIDRFASRTSQNQTGDR